MTEEEEIKKAVMEKLEEAASHLVNKIKINLNDSQPYRIYGKGRWYRGLEPSIPGQHFARKRRGMAQANWSYELNAPELKARIGTNYIVNKYLEEGTKYMVARDALRETIKQEEGKIKEILR